jgi:anti-sigma-K factor RskA
MEKTQNTIDSKLQKKILGFLDGSLSIEEKSEFEAYVRTHPEFEAQIKKKEDELLFLKNLIPVPLMSKETAESLESEMKLSIFNLLKEEPKNLADRVRNSWEEWVNR